MQVSPEKSKQKAKQMAFVVILPKKRQRIWEWPAVVNLTLGGTGAGMYLLDRLHAFLGIQWLQDSLLLNIPLLAALLVGLGFLSLTLEAGKPLRGYRLFSRLLISWMSIESLAGVIFLVTAIASSWSSSVLLRGLAVVAAMVLIVSQGMMLSRAMGVAAWNRKLMPFLFITSGLTTACGLLSIFIPPLSTGSRLPIVVVMFFAAMNLITWLVFLNKGTSDSNRGLEFLRRPSILLLIGGIGHLLPILFFGVVFLLGNGESRGVMTSLLSASAGLMLLGGGVCQKIGVVIAAGYFRSMLLDSHIEDSISMPMN